MKNEFIPYEEALALKELGFEELCFGFYREEDKQLFPHSPIENHIEDLILAPLYQQAFRWLLENRMDKEDFMITRNPSMLDKWDGQVFGLQKRNNKLGWSYESQQVSYQEAQDACLRKLIEIIKNKEDE